MSSAMDDSTALSPSKRSFSKMEGEAVTSGGMFGAEGDGEEVVLNLEYISDRQAKVSLHTCLAASHQALGSLLLPS